MRASLLLPQHQIKFRFCCLVYVCQWRDLQVSWVPSLFPNEYQKWLTQAPTMIRDWAGMTSYGNSMQICPSSSFLFIAVVVRHGLTTSQELTILLDWSQTHSNPPASISQVLGLQEPLCLDKIPKFWNSLCSVDYIYDFKHKLSFSRTASQACFISGVSPSL